MDSRQGCMTPPNASEVVETVEPEVVRQLRELAGLGSGRKRIAIGLGLTRGAARRSLG